jgi:hypothetical protein
MMPRTIFRVRLVGFLTSILVGSFGSREFGLNTVGLNSDAVGRGFLNFW